MIGVLYWNAVAVFAFVMLCANVYFMLTQVLHK